jgi:hypothetical protein
MLPRRSPVINQGDNLLSELVADPEGNMPIVREPDVDGRLRIERIGVVTQKEKSFRLPRDRYAGRGWLESRDGRKHIAFETEERHVFPD